MTIYEKMKDILFEASVYFSYFVSMVWLRRRKYPQFEYNISADSSQYKFEYLSNHKNELTKKHFCQYLRIYYNTDTYGVDLGLLLDLFNYSTPKYLMTYKEQKILKQLPDPVTVYRGTSPDEIIPRLSWSLDLTTALRFSKGRVFMAVVPKNKVFAYIDNNYCGEKEIITYVTDNYKAII